MKKLVIFLMSLVLALSVAGMASAIPVDLELSLLVDVSGSIIDSEFTLQKQGYVNAFNNSSTWDAISQGSIGSIAVNLIYWSSFNQQVEAVGWSLIDSYAASQSFANAIDATTRPFFNNTGVQSALIFGANSFSTNYTGTRSVIDISGDGVNNSGTGGTVGKDYALANGVDTINGIVIGNDPAVLAYYTNFVIGGSNAFALQVANFTDFGTAIDSKIVREISPVPEPSAILLMGAGLLGLVTFGRKRFSKKI